MVFRPRGDTAQWRVIYDHISQMKVDEVVTYETITNLLPDAAEGSWRGALFQAVKALEENDRRTLANVRGVGYRMVHAVEHATLAKRQKRAASRRMKSAVSKISSARREDLTPEQRRKFDEMEANLRAQQDMLARLELRQARVESRQEATDSRVAASEKDAMRLADKLDQLREDLRRRGLLDD